MEINKAVVEKYLRASIFVCIVAFILMLCGLIFWVDNWALWIPGLIANVGVIISFGVYLNKLNYPFGHLQEAEASDEQKPVLAESRG